MTDDEVIARVLTETSVWAIVGLSPDPDRDSNRVAARLQRFGKRIIPVNPTVSHVLGEPTYPNLDAIPTDVGIDVVDIFRRSDQAGRHVDEAIARGARAVWLQLGVIDHDAAARAEAAGLDVVMDRCPAIEIPKLEARP